MADSCTWQFCAGFGLPNNAAFFWLNILVDILFGLDMMATMRTAFMDATGVRVALSKKWACVGRLHAADNAIKHAWSMST